MRAVGLRLSMILHAIQNSQGVAALELALLAPLLLFILTCSIELGFMVHDTMQVQHAAEAGGLYALKGGWDPNGIASAVSAGGGSAQMLADPQPERFCGCINQAGLIRMQCGTPCPGGQASGTYVRVTAKQTRRSAVQSVLPLPAILSAEVVVRQE